MKPQSWHSMRITESRRIRHLLASPPLTPGKCTLPLPYVIAPKTRGPRVMNRVVASNVSEYFANEHRTHGVKLICNTRVVRLEGHARVERVVCADGSTYETDLLLVGVGAIANVQLASDA